MEHVVQQQEMAKYDSYYEQGKNTFQIVLFHVHEAQIPDLFVEHFFCDKVIISVVLNIVSEYSRQFGSSHVRTLPRSEQVRLEQKVTF